MIRRGCSALWTIQEKEDKEKMGDRNLDCLEQEDSHIGEVAMPW
jgi:hypothetical protein